MRSLRSRNGPLVDTRGRCGRDRAGPAFEARRCVSVATLRATSRCIDCWRARNTLAKAPLPNSRSRSKSSIVSPGWTLGQPAVFGAFCATTTIRSVVRRPEAKRSRPPGPGTPADILRLRRSARSACGYGILRRSGRRGRGPWPSSGSSARYSASRLGQPRLSQRYSRSTLISSTRVRRRISPASGKNGPRSGGAVASSQAATNASRKLASTSIDWRASSNNKDPLVVDTGEAPKRSRNARGKDTVLRRSMILKSPVRATYASGHPTARIPSRPLIACTVCWDQS